MLSSLKSGGAMPDAYGRLTPEDNAKIQQWWVGRWNAPVICPVCKTTEVVPFSGTEWRLG
jgi:hypothetical protein